MVWKMTVWKFLPTPTCTGCITRGPETQCWRACQRRLHTPTPQRSGLLRGSLKRKLKCLGRKLILCPYWLDRISHNSSLVVCDVLGQGRTRTVCGHLGFLGSVWSGVEHSCGKGDWKFQITAEPFLRCCVVGNELNSGNCTLGLWMSVSTHFSNRPTPTTAQSPIAHKAGHGYHCCLAKPYLLETP